jgi:hypothetical protein
MQIFPYNSKGITSSMSTQVVNNGKNLVNVIKERPLGVLDSHASSIGLSNKARAKTVRFFLLFIRLLYFRLPLHKLLSQIIIFFWLPTCFVLQV